MRHSKGCTTQACSTRRCSPACQNRFQIPSTNSSRKGPTAGTLIPESGRRCKTSGNCNRTLAIRLTRPRGIDRPGRRSRSCGRQESVARKRRWRSRWTERLTPLSIFAEQFGYVADEASKAADEINKIPRNVRIGVQYDVEHFPQQPTGTPGTGTRTFDEGGLSRIPARPSSTRVNTCSRARWSTPSAPAARQPSR